MSVEVPSQLLAHVLQVGHAFTSTLWARVCGGGRALTEAIGTQGKVACVTLLVHVERGGLDVLDVHLDDGALLKVVGCSVFSFGFGWVKAFVHLVSSTEALLCVAIAALN